MLRSINSSDTFGESARELDEAVSEIKSNPLFPKVVISNHNRNQELDCNFFSGIKRLFGIKTSGSRESVINHSLKRKRICFRAFDE